MGNSLCKTTKHIEHILNVYSHNLSKMLPLNKSIDTIIIHNNIHLQNYNDFAEFVYSLQPHVKNLQINFSIASHCHEMYYCNLSSHLESLTITLNEKMITHYPIINLPPSLHTLNIIFDDNDLDGTTSYSLSDGKPCGENLGFPPQGPIDVFHPNEYTFHEIYFIIKIPFGCKLYQNGFIIINYNNIVYIVKKNFLYSFILKK